LASFTDNLVAFNPYVQQIPVDDYVRVGMIKQKNYDEGVQKVQGYIDSIAGLEVLKPEQKDYLHQRINNLQQEVGRVVQADFSNQQLINSVGALTSKIASDPIIQTSVDSTRTYKQGVAAMKEARDKGKSSVSNEWEFQDQFQKWYNDGDVTTKFSGSFTPYTDVTTKISGIIKSLEPNSQIEDNPFKRGPQGQILMDADGLPQIDWAMIEKGSKTLTPERIRAAIQANMTQDDLNQLRIDGRYSYRGQDAAGMKAITDQSYQYKLDQVNDIIQGLMVQRATANNNPQMAAQIDAQIQAYKDRAVAYQNAYGQDIAVINNNLEGYKGQMYTQNWLNKFGDGYAYAQNSLTYKENPYFMAAERRREKDIKFKEFMAKHELDVLQYGLDVEKLGIEREKLEAYKMSLALKGAGKTAKGALEGIGLSDAILEPIQQAELENINVSSFISDTKAIDDEIDTQKMAILASNTDLVVLKKDASGRNPHYEYNVAGRDPNTVISAADAALARLKDAYDKDPNSVDDGVRTYFKNLANADQVVQNRKFAIGQIQGEADAEHNLTPLLSRFKNFQVKSAGGASYNLTPQMITDFNTKLDQTYPTQLPSGASGGVPTFQNTNLNDALAKRIMNTPEEKFMYSIFKKHYDGKPLNDTEKQLIGQINTINSQVNNKSGKVLRARDTYMNNAVRNLVGTQQPVSFTLEAFKTEDKNRAKALFSRMANTIIAEDKENPNPRYDEKDVKKMLGDDSGNTSYSLVSKGRGKYALALSNTSITGDPIEMDISRQQAEELFGQGQFLDDFYNIRQSMQLTKNTGKWTTDVRGLGREGAFNLQTGLLNKYSVKYHVEDPLKNGGLQIRMYIYDKKAGQWLPERTANFGQLLNEAQVTKALSSMNDQYIDAMLNSNQ
jgi:hypothetical protein